ncbi:hypothetical protein BJ508DRAFT_302164 [Ascobolus immersus RN42]|uniref:Uncharacterized protein n=1 Tax=Ascobolus immersus RN42 TaxID=1160509 RepID=A0A3N4IPY6_ASCIM|nr:hypothetical protein BJ508DRAFT_302164 [Ascobolus immersus RN42]
MSPTRKTSMPQSEPSPQNHPQYPCPNVSSSGSFPCAGDQYRSQNSPSEPEPDADEGETSNRRLETGTCEVGPEDMKPHEVTQDSSFLYISNQRYYHSAYNSSACFLDEEDPLNYYTDWPYSEDWVLDSGILSGRQEPAMQYYPYERECYACTFLEAGKCDVHSITSQELYNDTESLTSSKKEGRDSRALNGMIITGQPAVCNGPDDGAKVEAGPAGNLGPGSNRLSNSIESHMFRKLDVGEHADVGAVDYVGHKNDQ